MRAGTTTNIGTLAAVPLLLSLLALAAVVYVASVTGPRSAPRVVAESKPAETGIAAAERQRLADAVAEADRNIRALEQQLTVKAEIPATDLVPTGTRRPAVFVECTADGAWIMPEHRRLAPDAPVGDGTTLLARVASTHFVVFLVRPSGVRTFAAYRAVLERHNASASAHVDYGFEPVDAGWKLAYPGGDA